MQNEEILKAIDQQIDHLRQARALLTSSAPEQIGKRRGRPKGSSSKTAVAKTTKQEKASKRTLSPEGKARIAAAQKARWAAQKKSSKAGSTAAVKTRGKAIRNAVPRRARKIGAPAKTAVAATAAAPEAEAGTPES